MEKVKDPVCGMTKEKEQMPFKTLYKNKSYYFCSRQCQEMFLALPRGYAAETNREEKQASAVKEKEKTIYTCPMHPEIEEKKPGRCPECGMELLPSQRPSKQVKKKTGEQKYEKHAGHSLSLFLRKFWVSLLLTIPVVLYSGLLEKFFALKPPSFPGSAYLSLIFASLVFFYGGWVFLASAYRELKARLPGMMTLIALAITVAYFYSLFATFFGGTTLFWELTTLITIMLLGHYLEMRAVQGAQSALRELSKLLPETAELIIKK